MEVISLDPYRNSHFSKEDDPEALEYLDSLIKVYEALENGTLYCRYIDGDRKGSIARLIRDPQYRVDEKPTIGYGYRGYRDGPQFTIRNNRFHVISTWDGRKNKVKESLPHREAELLIGYEGPTVWEKFDAKAAKEEILKNPNQKDIDGNVLAIGDKVMYVNARYGSGMVLTRGVITEFLASVNSQGFSITTVIESKDGEISNLSYPENMVSKL